MSGSKLPSSPRSGGSPAAPSSPSSWTPLLLRASAVLVALFALAWIGRTAAAGPSSVPAADALDAGGLLPQAPASPLSAGDASTTSTALPLEVPAAPPAAPASGVTRGRATPSEPVYLNHASVDELRRLPGVGPKRAEAILVLRQKVGRFSRVEDLLRVKGVGRGAVKKWRPLVRLDAPPAPGDGDAGAGSG
ncbi:MAG: competence protein ComEA helix-hairpin-helix repeat protein [Labilithrix sp.]|nr:competence protein ComEA helix-hairpin-helix repeat protein [Labilithrix sp.]